MNKDNIIFILFIRINENTVNYIFGPQYKYEFKCGPRVKKGWALLV